MRGVAVVLVACLCFPVVAGDHDDVFAPSGGGFTVQFPGKPKESPQTAKSPLGELKVYIATFAMTDGTIFLVSYTDYPVSAVKPESVPALLDGVREGLRADGELLSETDIVIGTDKLPGREVTVKKLRTQHMRVRVVIKGARLYQVSVLGSAEFVRGKKATRFLESFSLSR